MSRIAYLRLTPVIIAYCPDYPVGEAMRRNIPTVQYDNATELWEEVLPAHHLAVRVDKLELNKLHGKLTR